MKTIRIASVFKDSLKTSYEYAKSLKKCANVLVPDGVDGWHVFPFTSYGHKVTTYEPDSLFIHGGEVFEGNKKIEIYGLEKRLKAYDKQQNVCYLQKNFFEQPSTKKYDFVYAVQSLSRECNSHISMEEKIHALQNAVKEGGCIYIYYYLAIIDDVIRYPINQYPRDGDISSYFSSNEWEVLYQKDRKKIRLDQPHFGNPTTHYHRIGYIYARKINKEQELEKTYYYHFNLSFGRKEIT